MATPQEISELTVKVGSMEAKVLWIERRFERIESKIDILIQTQTVLAQPGVRVTLGALAAIFGVLTPIATLVYVVMTSGPR